MMELTNAFLLPALVLTPSIVLSWATWHLCSASRLTGLASVSSL